MKKPLPNLGNDLGPLLSEPMERRRACGKVQYDKKGAQSAANLARKRRRGGMRLEPYHCCFCNHWHLTSQ